VVKVGYSACRLTASINADSDARLPVSDRVEAIDPATAAPVAGVVIQNATVYGQICRVARADSGTVHARGGTTGVEVMPR